MFPFVLLPLAALIGRAYDRLFDSDRLARFPVFLRGALCSAGVLSLGFVAMAGPRHPLESWCPPGGLDTQSAGGTAVAVAAILEDLQRNPSARPIVVGNFNSGAAVMDSAFPVVQGLGLAGVPLSRLSCCVEGQEDPIWYWLISPIGGPLGSPIFAGIPGAEVLLQRPATGEWIVALRTPEARERLQARFCESFEGEIGLSLVSHDAAMSRLPVQLPQGLEVPIISWDCQTEGGGTGPDVRAETPVPGAAQVSEPSEAVR